MIKRLLLGVLALLLLLVSALVANTLRQGSRRVVVPPLAPLAVEALTGLAEKGSVSLKSTAQAAPGHSSMPPAHCTSMRSSAMTCFANASANAELSPGKMPRFTTAAALPGSTFSLLPAFSMVGAVVVRSIASLDVLRPSMRSTERSIREVLPDARVAPGLVLAATDSRHTQDLAEQTYRFMPIRFKSQDVARVHGTDERISGDQLVDMVCFYFRLLQQSAQ
jgi:acetylornithine deacetylase/succinyl-diaminopimelate desuccinylase-like protein